jgi:hypothetical protein
MVLADANEKCHVCAAHSGRFETRAKAIALFIRNGHPLLAFAVAMSWIWRGVVVVLLTAGLAAWLP